MISGLISLVVGIIGAIVGFIAGILGPVVGVAVPLVLAIIIPLAILGVPLLMIMATVWLLGLPSARRARRHEPEDARLMQEINRGLARMENRLYSLETIMLDDEMKVHSPR